MKNTLFNGVATALITPMTKTGVDYESLKNLLEWQINSGVNAVVICGTTGEGSTLTDEEHKTVIKFAVDVVNKRIPVIAGTGSNDTEYAIELSKYACEVGVDGLLLVTPYYNKATQKGLEISFKRIADEVNKPIILYNVPSRTGVNLLPATVKKLAEHKNIVAIKEASGNISQIAELISLVGDEIDVYSGNDDQIVPVMSLGGKGVISVLSNVMPKETVEICNLFFNGKITESAKLQLKLLPLINALFSEVNPIPVKFAMEKMGWCKKYIRLPLTEMEATNSEKLVNIMRGNGLNV